MKVGETVYVFGEISEIRHDGTIIIKSSTGDYFGVGREAVKETRDIFFVDGEDSEDDE